MITTPVPTQAPSSVPSTVGPTVTPTAAPAATPSQTMGLPTATGWRSVADQPSVTGGQPSAVVWTGTRFIATGYGPDNHGEILDSSDGLAWHPQIVESSPGYIGPIAVGSHGIVALGTSEVGTAAWVSPDGLAWTSRDDAFPASGVDPEDYVAVNDVVDTDSGWLAVGREEPPCGLGCGPVVRSFVWTSPDGLHWTEVPHQASLDHAGMTSVTRAGAGFVAVGLAGNHGAVWTSPDGRVWSRVPDAPLFHAPSGTDQTFGASMTGVTTATGTIVAVGVVGTQDGVGSALAWWSADGRHWSRATGTRFRYGQLFDVNAVPGGFLAVGPSGGRSCLGGIWSSADGRAWQCIAADPMFADFGPYAVAASPELVVVVGLGAEGPNGLLGAIWVH